MRTKSRKPLPPKVLQNIMGHSDIKTTLEHYTEIELGDLADWAESMGEGL